MEFSSCYIYWALILFTTYIYEYKLSKDKNIKYIGLTSRLLTERVKEYFKGKTALSGYISNCNNYKNNKITINNFSVLKGLGN